MGTRKVTYKSVKNSKTRILFNNMIIFIQVQTKRRKNVMKEKKGVRAIIKKKERDQRWYRSFTNFVQKKRGKKLINGFL